MKRIEQIRLKSFLQVAFEYSIFMCLRFQCLKDLNFENFLLSHEQTTVCQKYVFFYLTHRCKYLLGLAQLTCLEPTVLLQVNKIFGPIVKHLIFLTFPACFKIPIFFSNLNSNCSNLSDLRNLQEQVKKAFCYQKLF